MKRAVLFPVCLFLITSGIFGQGKNIQPEINELKASLINGSITPVVLDTSITGSQFFHPLFKQFPAWSDLGNLGFPSLPLRYNRIQDANIPAFLSPYLTYLNSPNELHFFNTKLPFSQIRFNSEVTGDKNKVGQNLNFFYTRNIGPEVNLTGLFDFISSNGNYSNQSSTESIISLKLSVEKPRYRHYAGFDRIQFKLQENGGVVNDVDAVTTSKSFLSTVPVNLNKAASKTTILRLKGWQYIDIIKPPARDTADSTALVEQNRKFKPTLIHRYNLTSANRLYNDKSLNMSFYRDTLISPSETNDSIQHISLTNDVNIRLNGFIADSASWSIEAGLIHEILHFYSHDRSSWKQSIGLGSSAIMQNKSFLFSANGELIMAGYRAGDHQLEIAAKILRIGKLSGPELTIRTKAFTPDMFVSSYMGNHFMWENSFKKQIEQGVDFSWDIPNWGLVVNANVNLISNWIYFNDRALPSQLDNSAVTSSAGLTKLFKAGPFRSNNSVFFNFSSVEEIPIPSLVASSSTFMHHDIHFPKTNGLLQLEYGFDIRFLSNYKGYAYMPATGVFYLQNEKLLGNYPVLDVFLIMRVKRTRFFVSWAHVNSGYTGDNIFPVLHYPLKQRTINYGVYWHFHD